MSTSAEQLRAGLTALQDQGQGLSFSLEQEQKLLLFLELLAKWNQTYNLTAIREVEKMISHHVLDSLTVLPYCRGKSLLDVGSGGGLPGLPIAIMCPELSVSLLDSQVKKTAFLEQARLELKLPNVQVITERVENLPMSDGYDMLISRAFATLAEFVTLAGKQLKPEGCLLAMKGVEPHEELRELPSGWRAEQIVLRVPGLDAQRCLVVLQRL